MNKKIFSYLFAVLAVFLSTQASASTIPFTGFSDTAIKEPSITFTRQTEDAVLVRPEMEKPAVVIMGDSADLYLLFSHHVIGFNSRNESHVPEAGKILDNIR